MKRPMNAPWFVALCFATLAVGCNRGGDYVAEVAGERISGDAFAERYRLYLENTRSRDNIQLRKQILNNMINELLIYNEVRRQGLENDETSSERLEEIRLQALLDGYARRVSVDTMSFSEQELMREFRIYNSKVSARYLYAKTEAQAWNLKRQLERGATFEQLAREVFQDPGLANNGGYLGTFGWGEMEPALEDVAFSLPVSDISDPIRLKIGYAIVKVEGRIEQPLASEYDYANSKEKLGRALQEKKTVRFVTNAAEEARKELAPTFNEEAVEFVFNNWGYAAKEPQRVPQVEHDNRFPENRASVTLVNFGGKSWSVAEFLKKLEKTTAKQRRRVKSSADVKDVAIGLATREVLLHRAREAGLENDPDVRAQIKKARDAYLLKRWASSVQDTVGQHGWDEKLMRRIYNEDREQYAFPLEVNVAEILVRSKSEGESILKQLHRGQDFATIARKHSIRLWAASRGGELGFGTRAKYGVLGDKFFSARIGEVIGPEWVDPYFGVFKILEQKNGRSMSFEEARDQIGESLAFTAKQDAMKLAVENLRAGVNPVVNIDNLANVILK